MKINYLEFQVRAGTAGPPLWYVHCPQIPGLLAAKGTIPEALEDAAGAIRDLALAAAMAHADGEGTKPIFVESKPSGNRDALIKYGHHLGTCQAFQGGACSCGFDEAKGSVK